MKEIKSIVIYTQEGIYDSAIVTYVDDTEENIDGFEEVCKIVREFSTQKGIMSRDLLNNPEYIAIVEKEKEVEEHMMDIDEFADELRRLNPGVEIRLGDSTTDSEALVRFFSSVAADKLVLPEGFECNDKNEITNEHHTKSGYYVAFRAEPLPIVKKEDNKKKKGVLIGTLAVVTALAIGTGLWAYFKSDSFKGFNNTKKSKPDGNTKTISQTIPTDDKEYNGSMFPLTFDAIRQDDKSNSTLYNLVNQYLNGQMSSEIEMENMLKIISNMCQTNMNDVTNLLENHKFMEDQDVLDLQNLFEVGSDSYVVLEKFCTLRNNVVNAAYNRNDSKTITEIRTYLDEFINFFYRQNVIKNGQYSVVPNNVELLAQHIAYTMYMKMLEQPIGYTVRLDGEVYDQSMLIERAYQENLELLNGIDIRVNSRRNTR